jgi:putative phage-type endonuclease
MSYIEQGSEAWHELRKTKIGASDAAVILGISPYKTPYQLWQEKLGLYEQKQTGAMRRGKEMEDEAREYFSSMLGISFFDDVKTKGRFLASLDGISLDKTKAIEIKCPSRESVEHFMKTWEVPKIYYPQIQQQMYVYDLDEMYYGEYYPGVKCVVVRVERDDEFISNYTNKALEFWECVETRTPPPFMDRDYVPMDDNDEWKETVISWNECQYKLREYEGMEIKLRDLLSLTQGKNCSGCGLRVSKIKRSGAVDYKAIPELDGVDLDKFRKPSLEYWKISKEGEDEDS